MKNYHSVLQVFYKPRELQMPESYYQFQFSWWCWHYQTHDSHLH